MKRAKPPGKLGRAAALAEAPWVGQFPPAWESLFRTAYAERLDKRGFAIEGRKGGTSGAPGTTELVQARLYLSEDEYAEQRAEAKSAGLKWSTWARRKLSQ